MGLAGSDKDGDDDKAGERAGTLERGDIYKMRAYRDAIPDARSVWILYPRGIAFRLVSRQFLHPRGCPRRCRVLARFRLLRLSRTRRRAVVGEGQPRTMNPCERHCDGSLWVDAHCQLHHTFCNVSITFGSAYSVINAVRAQADYASATPEAAWCRSPRRPSRPSLAAYLGWDCVGVNSAIGLSAG